MVSDLVASPPDESREDPRYARKGRTNAGIGAYMSITMGAPTEGHCGDNFVNVWVTAPGTGFLWRQ